MANNKRTRADEASVQDGVQNVVVPSMPPEATVRVPRAPGLRFVNLKAWLAHNAHLKKYGNRKAKGCRFCRQGVAGIMATAKQVADVEPGSVAKSSGADEAGAATLARGGGER